VIQSRLPNAFADLEAHVEEWALPNERDRYLKLAHTSMECLRAFFDAMLPRAPDIVEHLKDEDPRQLEGDKLTLYHLLVTFVETAHPVELKWGTPLGESAGQPERLQFHGPSASY
jgi:hypothetical protein